MALELHIWGPAFSLPSIDPECLAAVAYCTHAVPRGEWALVASSDPSLSPTKELPALRDGTRWIGGYGNIIAYLQDRSAGQWYLDRALSPHQRADCTAFSALLHTHLAPLLALSLYVSSANYPVTRTAYSRLLPWPTQYLIPPHLRTAAKTRTHHLNLSSLDLDSTAAPQPPGQALIPPSLRKAPTTALQRADLATRFKLDALTLAAFAPLQHLLGTKPSLLTAEPSSLDCLALGYLSLALLPALPHPWLADALQAKHPPLCDYTRAALRAIGGADDVDLEHALGPGPFDPPTETSPDPAAPRPARLPWQAPAPRPGFSALAAVLVERAGAAWPFWSGPRILVSSPLDTPHVHASDVRTRQVGAVVAAAVGLAAGLVWAGLVGGDGGAGTRKRKLADMGEAGAMLAVVGVAGGGREGRVGREVDGGGDEVVS